MQQRTRSNRWFAVRTIIGVALLLAALAVSAAPAGAELFERFRFDDHETSVVRKFCGNFRVEFDFHDAGVVVAKQAGPGQLVRYTATHNGGLTITNLATGKALSATWNYLEQDVRATDNGDGTLTILTQLPGPERWYGPDGQVLFTDGGTIRLAVTIDDAGTPTDPSDDSFISEELVSANGGQYQGQNFDLCASFATLTS